jgi:cell division protein FtsI/penicillin-binding protein 2
MMKKSSPLAPAVCVLVVTLLFALPSLASSARQTNKSSKSGKTVSETAKQPAAKSTTRTASTKKKRRVARRRYVERYKTSSYANDVTEGDISEGEDPIVRAAAVEALGNMNGTVVAIDPDSGRILAMVNQKLALSEGAQPCSTFKVAVALAALNESIIRKDTEIQLGRRSRMSLTPALARSNNPYFEVLGRQLGFEKVSHYARQFGLGELAGWDIEGEHLGEFPATELEAKRGGVGRMCSYGEGISMTPLQLGAMISAIANGGTLYYLQHPRTAWEAATFKPRIKRELAIAPLIPDVNEGMLAAVDYGTGRSVRYSFSEESVLGKTGTCSNSGTRYGWFASYANTQNGRVVLVVFLRGGRPTYGPKAAEISGKIYRALYDRQYFADKGDRQTGGSVAGGGVSQ